MIYIYIYLFTIIYNYLYINHNFSIFNNYFKAMFRLSLINNPIYPL